MTRASFAALGKLGSEREFLRYSASDTSFVAYDEWVTDGMEWAARSAGADFLPAYRAGSAQAFVYRVSASPLSVVAGALAPSADSAGRDYPFSVLAKVTGADAFARQPETLPLLLEEVWQSASECVVDATATAGAHLESRLSRLYLPEAPSPAEATAFYSEWTHSLPVSDLRALLYGAPSGSGSGAGQGDAFETAMRFIIDLVKPHRGVDYPKTPLSLRLPLGQAGGAAVCFWIDVVRRAAGWKATLPSFFWSHDGGTGALVLHLGDPPKSTLAELWMPRGERDEFCDLTLDIPEAHTRFLSPLPQPLRQLLAYGDHAVHDFLRIFEAAVR